MFGLEKKNKKRKPFEFDLEKDLKSDSKKRAKLIEDITQRKAELKSMLREGTKSEDFEQCGVILQGYEALEKIIGDIEKE